MRSNLFKSLMTRKKSALVVSIAAVAILITGSISLRAWSLQDKIASSSEIGIAESSPAGESGGAIIPASCPSSLHDDPWYGTPCTQCNICGVCNVGAYQCTGNLMAGNRWWSSFWLMILGIQDWSPIGGGAPGACSVGPPANPAWLGGVCYSCNACGNCTAGTYNCAGVCSAVAPSGASCDLAICQGACNAGASSIRSAGGTFTVASGSNATLKACHYDTAAVGACEGGNDVTGAALWNDTNAPKDVSYFSAPGVINARFLNGQENLTARYGALPTKNATIQAVCILKVCGPLTTKSVTDTYCPDETKDTGISDGCGGTITCPGTRYCDTNWKEVAP